MIRSPGRARSTPCLVSAIIVTKRGDLLMSAIFRAYNDWLAEFCRTDPVRLKGIAMINLDDVPGRDQGAGARRPPGPGRRDDHEIAQDSLIFRSICAVR